MPAQNQVAPHPRSGLPSHPGSGLPPAPARSPAGPRQVLCCPDIGSATGRPPGWVSRDIRDQASRRTWDGVTASMSAVSPAAGLPPHLGRGLPTRRDWVPGRAGIGSGARGRRLARELGVGKGHFAPEHSGCEVDVRHFRREKGAPTTSSLEQTARLHPPTEPARPSLRERLTTRHAPTIAAPDIGETPLIRIHDPFSRGPRTPTKPRRCPETR